MWKNFLLTTQNIIAPCQLEEQHPTSVDDKKYQEIIYKNLLCNLCNMLLRKYEFPNRTPGNGTPFPPLVDTIGGSAELDAVSTISCFGEFLRVIELG